MASQVMTSLTVLADEIIETLHRHILQEIPSETRQKLEQGLSIVGLGGYGRGELSPYSDIDLMFLCRNSCQDDAATVSKKILQALWDAGFRVGHSLRTPDDCIALAQSDIVIRTSLMECRIITGTRSLFEQFFARFQQRVASRGLADFITAKIKEREKERETYGTTVYLLEPNIKMSQGGLRDIHLFRWLTLCRHQTASLSTLKDRGLLSKIDFHALTEAQEFLWQIRNELHFTANQPQDILTFDEQIRLAKLYGFQDTGHLLAVEQFMKQYYEKTTTICDVTFPLIEQMRPKPIFSRLKRYLKRQSIDGLFLISGDEISILPAARGAVLSQQSERLKLFYLAQIHNVRPSPETRDLIREITGPTIPRLGGEAASSATAIVEGGVVEPGGEPIFLNMLGVVGRVGWALRELHRLRLLEEIVPAFAKSRALMQFNAYHKYTVDEHSFRAVEEAEHFFSDKGQIGQVYREIHRKDMLHLALLLHDIGKGESADHSVVGAQIAEQAGQRLRLSVDEKGLLIFLVREHLLMTHLAFRRDLSDTGVLISFAKTVATPEALKMLYILTLADVAAVGGGTLTDWKKELLAELFSKTMQLLTGEDILPAEEEQVIAIREWISARAESIDREWVEAQLPFMTTRYLLTTPRERILEHLAEVYTISREKVRVTAHYHPGSKITEYTVYTVDTLTEAIFSKISGVLAAKGLQILGATIVTWENQIVIDTFQVEDPDYVGAPHQERLDRVCQAIRDVLLGNLHVETLLAHGGRRTTRVVPRRIPTQVAMDNLISDHFTVIDLFAEDRQGLLYFITRALFDAGLSVHAAKISTQLDQIVDVFYVTYRGGGKLIDPSDIVRVKEHLIAETNRFLG